MTNWTPGWERFAEDHGYYHWKCRDCGASGWTDTSPDCARTESVHEAECPKCGSHDRDTRKLVADTTCHEYGGPTLWDPCTDSWHEAETPEPESTKPESDTGESND